MKKFLFAMAAASAISAILCLNGYAEETVSGESYVTAIVEADGTAQEALNNAEDQSAVSGNETQQEATTNTEAQDALTEKEGPIAVMTGNDTSTDTTGIQSNGPVAGTGTEQTAASEFGPSVGGIAAETAQTDQTAADQTAEVQEETLPLPSGYHFNNIAPYTYQNMVDDLTVLKAQYPNMQMDVLAATADSRNLYHVVVGNPLAKHKILVHAGIHAREYIVCQVVMRQIASLLEMQQAGTVYKGCSIPDLLNNTCIHFVPMVDPDGITLVQGGLEALNSEDARMSVMTIAGMDNASDMEQYLRTWKNNLNGVNLNRNFDANWEETPSKVDHPSSMNYKGTAPECEIETKVLADLTRSLMPDRTISYHTQGKVIYWYFGETGNYKNEGYNLASIVNRNTGYRISNTWAEKDAAGFKDWAVQKLDIPSVTIECGIGTSPVDESQIEEMWAGNDGILPDVMIDLVNK
ncbi:M14 family zinc carboxypeptidase [Oribacterium sp. FC2011]|uniref:M14 family zinc carboxypeptidase n=1 Tax=Oribacterium sp. FC2011 TaxID=1408311 RepID=UPI0006793E52|nr:M14 family zinc carboxypeptidase [Oribacterium sp. FC2011]